MARSKALLPLLFLLGLASLSSGTALATTKFDFFYLTLLWPGTLCNGTLIYECCRPSLGKPASDFFVEALKPYDNTTGEPVIGCSIDCCFSFAMLWEVMGDLFSYWIDVSCPSKNGIQRWEDAWCTYGTCSNLSELVYFQQALALRKQVDPLSILERNGIVPSNTNYYKLEDIQNALDGALGSFSTVVECKQKYFIFGDHELNKIHICVSSDGKSIINCPTTKKSNCGSEVKFLAFDPNQLHYGSADIMPVNPIKMPVAKDLDM